jgi:hypothetical protein
VLFCFFLENLPKPGGFLKNRLCLQPQAPVCPTQGRAVDTSCLPLWTLRSFPGDTQRRHEPSLPPPVRELSLSVSLLPERRPNPSPMADNSTRHSAPPQPPPMSPEALPRRPLPPCRRNRPAAPGITAGDYFFPAGSELAAAKIRYRWPSSGPADHFGAAPMSLWFRRAPPRPPSCPPSPPERRPAPRPPCRGGHDQPADQVDLVQRGLAGGPSGPSAQTPWVKMTPVQKVMQPILFPEKFRKCSNLRKFIENYPFIGKIQMTCQNAQNNVLYMFMSNSCIVRQL